VADDEVDGVAQKPAVHGGVSAEDYAMWVNSDPIAVMLMRFLRDYRDAAIRDMTASWENGSLDQKSSDDMRGYCRALKEITTVRIPEIAQFYDNETASAVAAEEAERAELNGR
jgi:hypothetical protein